MTPLTLGRLARKAGLARATLLHYEAAGLLLPAGRSLAGYRLYGESEVERLRTIRSYREAGLPLAAIGAILADDSGDAALLLEKRLLELSAEVERLRAQQKVVARLLAHPALRSRSRLRSKDDWVALLREAGLDEIAMHRWHAAFEADSPVAHAAFLVSLGVDPDEIERIRRSSRMPPEGRS